ncbi:MADS-box transcription factor 23-like isoform X2 [Cynara cardunculus var. scolymus]|uniref:MADS-box transcription factor 23-like isoform X2 n=1 Tax=Cynara cardunculus var. scolymus TaxID=59895 RepID=UPI000D6258B2|nr:MADS-box transcription factor 23-like isoform X2 [Cynara cardunculus var. scolymus]
MGRGKVEVKRIENATKREETFSRRTNGLLKKAFELSLLCDAEVALLIFSPSSPKPHLFSSHGMDRTMIRYRREKGSGTTNNSGIRTFEVWKDEMEEMKRMLEALETKHKHFAGDDLSTLGMKDLQKLERQLRIGVDRRRLLSEHISLLKRNLKSMQEKNTLLNKKLKDGIDGNSSLDHDIQSLKIAGGRPTIVFVSEKSLEYDLKCNSTKKPNVNLSFVYGLTFGSN